MASDSMPWGGWDFPGKPSTTSGPIQIPAFASQYSLVVNLTMDEFQMLQDLVDRNYGYTGQEVMRQALRSLHKLVEM